MDEDNVPAILKLAVGRGSSKEYNQDYRYLQKWPTFLLNLISLGIRIWSTTVDPEDAKRATFIGRKSAESLINRDHPV